MERNKGCSKRTVYLLSQSGGTSFDRLLTIKITESGECIGSYHHNLVHLVLAVSAVIVFGLRCCVHPHSIDGDRVLLNNVTVRDIAAF